MTNDRIRIELHPLGRTIDADRGAPLSDVLFNYGVEFPCGGKGLCRGCRVRVLSGNLPVTPEQEQVLSKDELSAGWRLACLLRADEDLALELAQWDVSILSDDTVFTFTPCEGLGVAIDLGTTTLVAQLIDRETGQVRGVETALNPQAKYGADLMSRVQYAVSENGRDRLTELIRDEIGRLIVRLRSGSDGDAPLSNITLVGNTVMHHLFSGIDPEPMANYPFEPEQKDWGRFRASELGWTLKDDPSVNFLPCLGGFVGSDILAGIVATRLHENEKLTALVDLGTNGEIVIGNREGILCASTAAGPAFEGGRISRGMRASTGAISSVQALGGEFSCQTIGHVAPRGICGSGLVDAVAVGLELGLIESSGRLAHGKESLPLCESISLSQNDIRQLQLAKGAIAAGMRILLERLDASYSDLDRICLAGAFGNYINLDSANRIGLFGPTFDCVVPAGNTAMLGAKMALFDSEFGDNLWESVCSMVGHVTLSADRRFQDVYVNEMGFPDLKE